MFLESEFETVLSQLGVQKPDGAVQGSGGPSSGSGALAASSYEAADLNQDGVVTAAELAQYNGSSSGDSQASFEMTDYTMKLVETMLKALKEEGGDQNSLDVSQFKQIMRMVNEQTQTQSDASKLNTYVANIA